MIQPATTPPVALSGRPAPARPVGVAEEVWREFCQTVHDAGFRLTPVPAGPGQRPRYVLDHRPRAVLRRINTFPGGLSLTDREVQVLNGLTVGKTSLEIGADLGLSEDTVKTHLRRLYGKLGAHDRAHAVALAYRRGVLTVDELEIEP
ncbi:helix-turn-helix domain-containing protein [Amycolatopsis alkalitolerans]|uniref:Helix-turn-helix transcriptional regulator n=1 Tax=Amycolatopsis alkalitolerans TaxID=2547244 RepID=A0A5C4LP93_9PSEU|nr:helix-turn-helix transcriptional regulator [Amycolatopsis alkalitolerans]